MHTLAIINVTIHTPKKTIDKGSVIIQGDKIAEVTSRPIQIQADKIIDGAGLHLGPGLVDLQINGGFDLDFTQNPAAIWGVGEKIPQYGCTSFLPTIITSPAKSIQAAQKVFQSGPPPNYKGATALGLHIEGPFLTSEKKGAHNPAYLQKPHIDLYADFSPNTSIRLVTLAPELPGANEVITHLINNNVLVSAGHSMATYQQAITAFDKGIRYGTHIFNAMPEYHQHHPGLVGALLDDQRIIIGLIADEIHVHPSMVRMIWKTIGVDRLTLVTDAMAALGRPIGKYILGDYVVIVDETSARLENGILAGSILSLDSAVKNLRDMTGCSIHDALKTATTNPARLLGLDHLIGKIEQNHQADIILFTDNLQIQTTIIKGEIIFNHGHFTNFAQ